MTFESNWGTFQSDDIDSWQKTIPSKCSLLPSLVKSQNSFLIQFRTNSQGNHALEEPKMFRITDDYDEISSFVIARKIVSELEVAPLVETPLLLLFQTDPTRVLKTRAKAMGFNVNEETTEDNFGLECTDNSNRRFIVFRLLNHLLTCEYKLLSTNSQAFGVVGKNINEKFLGVCALKQCTVSHSGEVQLEVEVFCYRCSPVLEQDFHDSDENSSEDYTMVAATRITAGNISSEDTYLTRQDQMNRSRGYSQYLPSCFEAFKEYWKLGYNIDLKPSPFDNTLVRIAREGQERIVPIGSLARCYIHIDRKTDVLGSQIAEDLASALKTAAFLSDVEIQTPGGQQEAKQGEGSEFNQSAGKCMLQTALQMKRKLRDTVGSVVAKPSKKKSKNQ